MLEDTLTHEGIYSSTALPMQLPYLLSDNDILKSNHIAYINPFRYRSYYYDTDTNLYYLTTRYYDPETGRFINADDISYADPETINGLNLFSYCLNNPIMHTDSTGTNWWTDFWHGVGNWFQNNWDIVIGVIATIGIAALSIATFGLGTVLVGVATGAIIGAGFGTVNALVNGDNLLHGMLSGLVVGALAGIGDIGIRGMLMAGLASGIGAATMSLIGDRVNGRQRDFAKAGLSALTAGLFSALGNGAGNFMAKSGIELAVRIVGNSLSSFVFSSYTFISDLIYDALRRR